MWWVTSRILQIKLASFNGWMPTLMMLDAYLILWLNVECVAPELCLNSLLENSSWLQNHSSWKRCWAPQYSEWYDAVSRDNLQAAAWCWWGPNRLKCNTSYFFYYLSFFNYLNFKLYFFCNCWQQMAAIVTVGFVKDAKYHIDVQGFNVYHKNRLIKVCFMKW